MIEAAVTMVLFVLMVPAAMALSLLAAWVISAILGRLSR